MVSDFNGGESTVSIPYTKMPEEDPDNIVIYYIAYYGSLRSVSNCKYEKGKVTFITNHFSNYTVGYNKVVFADLLGDKWYSKAINYISARGIMQGFEGNVNPDRNIRRADFLIMIIHAYDLKPNSKANSNFDDAGTNEYCTDYLAAAKELGIVNGTGNNKFNPQSNIIRQGL